jgi:hypothetical protein
MFKNEGKLNPAPVPRVVPDKFVELLHGLVIDLVSRGRGMQTRSRKRAGVHLSRKFRNRVSGHRRPEELTVIDAFIIQAGTGAPFDPWN